MARPAASSETYYRWTDASGRVHVVTSIEDVPHELRPRVERLELTVRPPPGVIEQARNVVGSPQGMPLVAIAGAGLLLFVLSWLMPRGWRWLGKLGAFAAVAALLVGLYLGAIRRSTGLGDDKLLATPGALIEDTKRAVENINQRQKERDDELRRIQNEAK